jgi:hypothetical protein
MNGNREVRGTRHCREEAERARQRAGATTDHILRASFLELADAYDQLAATLERPRPQ